MALSKIDVANMLTGIVPNDNSIRRPLSKPLIINGDMQVSQRTTSETGITDNRYSSCDRFKIEIDSCGTWTVIQEALTSGAAYNAGFRKALRLDCTTADASPASADAVIVSHRMEGQNLNVFKKGTSSAEKYTLAFWIKSNKTGTAQVNFTDEENTRMCSGQYTISSADTWEKKVINIAADTSGASDNDNTESIRISWFFDAGSNYTSGAVPTAWESTSAGDKSVSDLALADNTNNDVAITGVQLEVGEFSSTTIPPFQFEDIRENLLRCQRYFQHIVSGNHKLISYAHWASGSQITFILNILEMRAVPTIDYDNGNDYWAIGGSSGSTNTIDTLIIDGYSTNKCIGLYSGTAAGGTTGYAYYGFSDNASARLALVSEL
jgi:hypothetical protein